MDLQMQVANQQIPGIGSRGGVTTLTRSPSVGSSGSEGSGGPQSPPPIAPTWRQPYVGGVPPLPLGLGQAKPESLLRGDSGEAHLLGKRSRDDDEVSIRGTHSGNNVSALESRHFICHSDPVIIRTVTVNIAAPYHWFKLTLICEKYLCFPCLTLRGISSQRSFVKGPRASSLLSQAPPK